MFDLVNIFSIFLPQLLLYPNPKDPLNSQAASLLNTDTSKYNATVKDYVQRYALEESVREKHGAFLKSNQKANSNACGASDCGGAGNRREQKEKAKAKESESDEDQLSETSEVHIEEDASEESEDEEK